MKKHFFKIYFYMATECVTKREKFCDITTEHTAHMVSEIHETWILFDKFTKIHAAYQLPRLNQ